MKNIETILKENGVELSDECLTAIVKAVNENYKTIAEHKKLAERAERAEGQLGEATEALKKFEGLDAESVKTQIQELQDSLKQKEQEFKDKIAERDRNDALERELNDYEFTSRAARASIAEKVKSANLTYKDGKHLGFADLMEQIKAEDADAFKTAEKTTAKFTEKGTGKNGSVSMTKDQIFAIKDTAERQAAIAANPQLFT